MIRIVQEGPILEDPFRKHLRIHNTTTDEHCVIEMAYPMLYTVKRFITADSTINELIHFIVEDHPSEIVPLTDRKRIFEVIKSELSEELQEHILRIFVEYAFKECT